MDLPLRKTGSASLDMAYVAAGRFDGFFQNNINLWDIAAGSLLIKEAGGIVNDFNKFELNKINVRASSSSISEKMLNTIKNF